MANNVFANGREVSCKKADGKSICAFPDVCMTPPENPATPPGVPVPYPNTGMAKDTTSGSKNVKISGQEVMLKNKSYFKKSTGDEAGSAAKKGVVTSVNRGKVYFNAWSMDVKFEGQNIVRHLDLTTHNHGSSITNTITWAHLDTVAFGNVPECEADESRAKKACKNAKVQTIRERKISEKTGKEYTAYRHEVTNCSKECRKCQACILVAKKDDKKKCCKPNNTGHHLIEDHWVRPKGKLLGQFKHLEKKPGGPYEGAPTVCANKSRYHGKHGVSHGTSGVMEDTFIGKDFRYSDAKKIALRAHQDAYGKSGCDPACIEAQLDSFYGKGPKKKCSTPSHTQPLKKKQRTDAVKRVNPDTM